jgi:hypothetical protein
MRVSLLVLTLLAATGGCVQSRPPQSSGTTEAAPSPAYMPPAQPGGQPAWAPAAPPAQADAPTPAPRPQPEAAPSGPPPLPSVTLGKASISGQLANPDNALAPLRADFETCYAQALGADVQAAGTMLVALELGKDGAVTRADATPNGNLPASVQGCIRERAQRVKLAAPKAGSAIVSFTVTLSPVPVAAAAPSDSTPALEEVAISPPGFEHGDRVANFARKHARDCYRDALRTNARAEGRVSIALWLDDKGVVTKVEAAKTGTLPDSVPACIQKRARPARFPAPKVAPTVVTVPIRLALKPAK